MKKDWFVLGFLAFFGFMSNVWGAERQSVAEEWSQVKAELKLFREELKFPTTNECYPSVRMRPTATDVERVAAARAVWEPYIQSTAERCLFSPCVLQLFSPCLHIAELWDEKMYQALAEHAAFFRNAVIETYMMGNHGVDDLADFLELHMLQAYLAQIGHNAPQVVVNDIEATLEPLLNFNAFPPRREARLDEEDDGIEMPFDE